MISTLPLQAPCLLIKHTWFSSVSSCCSLNLHWLFTHLSLDCLVSYCGRYLSGLTQFFFQFFLLSSCYVIQLLNSVFLCASGPCSPACSQPAYPNEHQQATPATLIHPACSFSHCLPPSAFTNNISALSTFLPRSHLQ